MKQVVRLSDAFEVCRSMLFSFVVVSLSAGFLLMGGCGEYPEERYQPAAYDVYDAADSLAMRIVEGLGGREALESLRYLRFDFAVERNGERSPSIRHFWDRHEGDYRLEWQQGDTNFVALFNTDSREGEVFADGRAVEGEMRDRLLQRAYGRFINDTYWLMAPAKVFDPGVFRSIPEDSVTAEHEVLHLAFEDVGLTPGDQYWLYVDRERDLVTQWAYVLQGSADGRPQFHTWEAYEQYDTPRGPVLFSTQKWSADRARHIATDNIETMEQAPAGIFEDPNPRF